MKKKIIAMSISLCLLLSPVMASTSYGITVSRPVPVSRSVTVSRPSHVAKVPTPKASTPKSSSKAKSIKPSSTNKSSTHSSSNSITKTSSVSRNYSFNPFNRNFFLWVWLFGHSNEKEDKEEK